ncbi:hypothetical protein [Palleronia sp. LCG004]|uniref:hypothetical protein n=1 Tax=Palleronia sp. LCG004 TaxID=3079304 RepID=UPI002942B739|nr:hypothetical protein [Palleronia sp. LCG004]WOI58366.1 hypothetical protein RVY76_18460 [Palleronia sp. LCG004]
MLGKLRTAREKAVRILRGGKADLNGPRLHVVLISWEGQHRHARAIARAIRPALAPDEGLSVVYSNRAGRTERGPGNWVAVPQSQYFGPKFARSLALSQGADAMLQIQVDARSDDWPGLVARLRAALVAHPGTGLWAPEIDWTPYPLRAALLERMGESVLYRTAQTDGVVWALTRPVLDRLAELDFEVNNLGWGIDYAAIAIARQMGLEALCDTGVTVLHPRARGYDDARAEEGMTRFIAQLSPVELAEMRRIEALTTRRREMAVHHEGRWRAMGQARDIDPNGPFGAAVSEIFVRAGRVFVRGAEGLDLTIGDRALLPLQERPPLDEVPLDMPLAPEGNDTTDVTTGELGEWQMPGVATTRIALRAPEQSRTIRLGPPVAIPAGTGDLQLGVALAAHRRGGRLRLAIGKGAGGRGGDEVTIDIPESVGGGDRPERYLCHVERVPGADHAREATLFLDYEGGAMPPDETVPPMIFVARPHLVREPGMPDLIWPHEIRGIERGSAWYASDAGGPPEELRLGQAALSLLPEAPRIEAEREGYEIYVAAPDGPVPATLWSGEIPIASLALAPVPITLPWSEDTLRDIVPGAALTLRDMSGSRIWWTAPDIGGPRPDATD